VRQHFFSDFLHRRLRIFTFGDNCTSVEPLILAFCFTFGYTFTKKNRTRRNIADDTELPFLIRRPR